MNNKNIDRGSVAEVGEKFNIDKSIRDLYRMFHSDDLHGLRIWVDRNLTEKVDYDESDLTILEHAKLKLSLLLAATRRVDSNRRVQWSILDEYVAGDRVGSIHKTLLL